ncbi:MAG TPA: class F sortase [Streptosporangiaceae bacterium]|nr:class F sortase [Streptosporangiaceae bacterium]
MHVPRHRRKPPGRLALAAAFAAAVVGAGGASVAAFTLAGGLSMGAAATGIPTSVTTAVPRQVHDPRVEVLARSVPARISIPAIGVSAPVMKVGRNSDGSVQVPPLGDHNLAGWYDYGPAPGQPGAAVILGHVDSATGISVFFDLRYLRPADRIYVTLADGKVAAFVVDGLQKAAKTAFPTAAVYGSGKYPELRLITCGGPFDAATGHYLDNIIVYAHMITAK